MEIDRQLENLNYAIKHHPDAPANFLLRGEYWMQAGEIEQAREDLSTARELAEKLIETNDWVSIPQSYIDRIDEALMWIGEEYE